jgi:hypothetical protein
MRHRRYYEANASIEKTAFAEDRTRVDLTVNVQPGPW